MNRTPSEQEKRLKSAVLQCSSLMAVEDDCSTSATPLRGAVFSPRISTLQKQPKRCLHIISEIWKSYVE